MTVGLVLAWLGLVTLVGLNGFAAGGVAMLHVWRARLGRGSRILLPSGLGAFLFASSITALAIAGAEDGSISGEPPATAVVFGVCFVVALALSLPGALLMARKAEAPGDVYRAFE